MVSSGLLRRVALNNPEDTILHSHRRENLISYNENIFKIQKRLLRVMTDSGRLDSCRGLFKKFHILPLQSQYMFSILIFVVKNMNYFRSNTDIHYINICFNHNLNLPFTNLSIVQRGVLFSGSRIYNHLPSDIKLKSENIKEFKLLLKTYLT
jgi:hypothetical protein